MLLEHLVGVHPYAQPPGRFLVKPDNAVSNSYLHSSLRIELLPGALPTDEECNFSYCSVKLPLPAICAVDAHAGADFKFSNDIV